MDLFAGSHFDPLSLHRYMYAASNPVNNTDPTGLFTLAALAVLAKPDVYH